MDRTQMQKFADIARAEGVEYVYIAYIEETLMYNRSFDGAALAKQIYKVAMAKRNARLRRHTNAIINSDRGPIVSQMAQARYFARAGAVSDEYAHYIESVLLEGHQFDLERCIEAVFNAAMTKYERYLNHKILVNTGITVGVEDAV